jgi:predicted ATPase/class 3 adenylate cyclase
VVDLPSGTVSMLFSDVEQSTLLLRRLGPVAYAEALDSCRRVQRDAWAAFGGFEMGTEGDSFFVVFSRADDALGAAGQAQLGLSQVAWPGGELVRVRMGIHTGSPQRHAGGYVGLDVHRAARIAAAAHGGQVVVSDTTASVVGVDVPAGCSLRDLGRHQLKDLDPERLHQLLIPGLPADFPPLKSLGGTSNLPVTTTPLLGRRTDVTDLAELMAAPDTRLLTLTGPGGSGKTRLAVAVARQVADRFTDGASFVALEALTDAAFIWSRIGAALNLPSDAWVIPTFFDHVAALSALLVLDNLEQMDGAAAAVDTLLRQAPGIVVLATSRRPLNVLGEHQRVVAPLSLPTSDTYAEAESSAAVQLFVERARAVNASFALTSANATFVNELCRHLDGLPLAIELVAARSKVFGPRALLGQLDRALDLPRAGENLPARHSALRSTIDWSYQLLSTQQRALFRRLAVFAGGADQESVLALGEDDPASIDLAVDLVDASMLTVTEDDDGEPRFGMLETVRAFALDELAHAGELSEARRFHAHHFQELADRWDPHRVLTSATHAAHGTRQFGLERDNVREALAWATDTASEQDSDESRVTVGLALLSHVSWIWRHGDLAEGTHWLEVCLEAATGLRSPDVGRCLAEYAENLLWRGEPERSRAAAEQAVEMLRTWDPPSLTEGLLSLSAAESALGREQASRQALEGAELHARQSGDSFLLGRVLEAVAAVQMDDQQWEDALTTLHEAHALFRDNGWDYMATQATYSISLALRRLGRVEEALTLVSASLQEWLPVESSLNLAEYAEDYSALLAEAGLMTWVPILLGAADAERERRGVGRDRRQAAHVAEALAAAQPTMTPDEWTLTYQRGQTMAIEDALGGAVTATHPRR